MTNKKTNRTLISTDKEIDSNADNLTESAENTTLEDENKALHAQIKELRGRASERVSVNADSEPRKKRRKFVGRQTKLDVAYFFEMFPDMFKGKVLRWANDEDGNLQSMVHNDWEAVKLPDQAQVSDRMFADDRNKNSSKGSSIVRVPGGRGRSHDYIEMVLMMKEKKFFEEDEVQYQRDQMAAQEEAARAGTVNTKGQDGERVESVTSYAPSVGNGIKGMSIQKQQ